ncbi:alkylation response protein AidB-like acyl-CoA dehydrogenase [Crossiella equi]|uniref:Alkylation response protein AidB-like acyl-CoA dehydrogenase n=1 Tax=Crossiella equi TaxID=130796 RepID=A0ABS5ARN2_9PSEU|nr:acyl-CoA dehydrogenase family protein [Crossiella equi]MBP2478360.1 alkylation response protein AidB-like acyl-CoA dehydrogenase [Crossiella equi]
MAGPRTAALDIADLAREVAPTTEAGRALAPALLAALREHGLLSLGVPWALGGGECPPGEALAVAETLARGDASTGWCVSIATTSGLLGAYLAPEGAQEVFGDTRTVAAGVWAPRGRGTPVDGGVVVSGRWAFCSGIPHAGWLFAGFAQDGGAEPVLRVAALPKAELEVLDTWHTTGLRGTGSHDTVAREVFVPAHRTFSVVAGPPANTTALYRFPLFGFFALSVAAAALGNAFGALEEFLALARGRSPLGSRRTLAERSAAQVAVAEAEAALRAARLFCHQAVDEAWSAAQGTEPVPVAARTALRLAATHATRTAKRVVADLYDLAGGAAIYDDSPLQRRFRDAHTATAHFQVNQASAELTGRVLLGLPARTEQL